MAGYQTVQRQQKSPSMSELKEVEEECLGSGTVFFEPSVFYVHEVLKFKFKHSSTRDKVKSFNEATSFWDADKYLKNSKDGRKLKIAEYYTKMKHKPL